MTKKWEEEVLFGGGYSGGKSFKVFNEFVAVAKTGKSVKYVAKDWIAMDMKTYKAERTQLLARVREEVGDNEVCHCEKLECPIRRINQFREELIKKLEIISEEGKE